MGGAQGRKVTGAIVMPSFGVHGVGIGSGVVV